MAKLSSVDGFHPPTGAFGSDELRIGDLLWMKVIRGRPEFASLKRLSLPRVRTGDRYYCIVAFVRCYKLSSAENLRKRLASVVV